MLWLRCRLEVDDSGADAVFPSLFSATGFATGLKIGPGSLLEPLSAKVTCPVGTPAPDFFQKRHRARNEHQASERQRGTVCKRGYVPIAVLSELRKRSRAALRASGSTAIPRAEESLGAKVPSPRIAEARHQCSYLRPGNSVVDAPATVPPFSVKKSTPVWVLTLGPVAATNETSPVGVPVPLLGATVIFTVTVVP